MKQKLVEKYRDIPDDEFVPLECVDENLLGLYEINKLGKVRRKKTGRVLVGNIVGGYNQILLTNAYKTKNYYVHVLVAKTFILNPDPVNNIEVHHKNHERNLNAWFNLEWTSKSENCQEKEHKITGVRYVMLDKTGSEISRYSCDELVDYLIPNFTNVIPKTLFKWLRKAITNSEPLFGYYWTKINLVTEEYIKLFGAPNETDWKKVDFIDGEDNLYCNKNGLFKRNGAITPGSLSDSGYYRIVLSGKLYFSHRIVLQTFKGVSKDPSKNFCNHINAFTRDNRIENLEWVSQKGNMANLETVKKRQMSVIQAKPDGTIINIFNSLKEAADSVGCKPSCISSCARFEKRSFGGYLWCYNEEDIPKMQEPLVFKYDRSQNIVDVRLYCKDFCETSYQASIIKRCIESGRSYNGFYYSIGPRDFNSLSPSEDLCKPYLDGKILQYDLSGVLVNKYNSIKEASEVIGGGPKSIIAALNNKSKTSGGFIWKYEGREEQNKNQDLT